MLQCAKYTKKKGALQMRRPSPIYTIVETHNYASLHYAPLLFFKLIYIQLYNIIRLIRAFCHKT